MYRVIATPAEISYELSATEEMAEMQQAPQISDGDVLAVSVYILDLTGTPPEPINPAELRATLDDVQSVSDLVVSLSDRCRRDAERRRSA